MYDTKSKIKIRISCDLTRILDEQKRPIQLGRWNLKNVRETRILINWSGDQEKFDKAREEGPDRYKKFIFGQVKYWRYQIR